MDSSGPNRNKLNMKIKERARDSTKGSGNTVDAFHPKFWRLRSAYLQLRKKF